MIITRQPKAPQLSVKMVPVGQTFMRTLSSGTEVYLRCVPGFGVNPRASFGDCLVVNLETGEATFLNGADFATLVKCEVREVA